MNQNSQKMEKLAGKVAYITGGSRGIGLGIARELVKSGMRVALGGRGEKDLEKAVAELGAENAMGIVSDVARLADEKAAVAEVLTRWGQLDLVVANAGIGHFAPIDKLTPDAWHQMMDTNLSGAYHTLMAALDALKASKGYYITIASLAGTNFFPQGAGYNATKFGLVGFTQAVMLDLRPYGIKVTTIMPGSVATYFNDHVPSEKDAWKIQPADIGVLVRDLLQMHPRTLPSKIEVRPTRPDLK
jgi:NAD(P)-dependent dehydrogenase (short-subunit alcohol dehydrogenase family)